jgi:hypothetical protein
MLKEKIRKCIENYQTSLIEELENELNYKKEASEIDGYDVIDADDRSHQSQAQIEEQLVYDRLQSSKAALEHLKKIPLTESDQVTEGALIETRDLVFYVGIITQKFTEDGRNIIGISTAAPIYKTLHNQTVNFPFQFAGVDCKILSIH